MDQVLLFLGDNPLILIISLFAVALSISFLIVHLTRPLVIKIKSFLYPIEKQIEYFFCETVPGTLILSTGMLFIAICGENIDKVSLCLAIFGYVKAIIYTIIDVSENKKTEY